MKLSQVRTLTQGSGGLILSLLNLGSENLIEELEVPHIGLRLETNIVAERINSPLIVCFDHLSDAPVELLECNHGAFFLKRNPGFTESEEKLGDTFADVFFFLASLLLCLLGIERILDREPQEVAQLMAPILDISFRGLEFAIDKLNLGLDIRHFLAYAHFVPIRGLELELGLVGGGVDVIVVVGEFGHNGSPSKLG